MILALVAVLATAAPAPEPRIVADVCKAFCVASVAPFDSLAADSEDLAEPQFEAVRNLVSRYDDVQIGSCTPVSSTPSKIILDVIGSGTTRNAFRRREPIPRTWYLALSAEGKLVSVDDETSHVLESLIRARGDRERTQIAGTADVPMGRIARALITRDSDGAQQTALFLLTWAEEHRDLETEAYALCSLGEFARGAKMRDKAARLFDAAIDVAAIRQLPDVMAYASFLAGMNTTNPATKAARLNDAACELEKSDDPEPALFAIFELVHVVDDIPSAPAHLDRLEAFASTARSIRAEMMLSMGRAILAQSVTDLAAYAGLLQHEIECAHRVRDVFWEARGWTNLGQAFQDMDQRDRAIEALHHASLLFHHASVPAPLRSYASSWLGIDLIFLGRMEEAKKYVAAAFDLPSDTPSRIRVYPLYFLEHLRHEEGRCSEAIEAAREAIRIDPSSLVMVWTLQSDLGDLLAESGDLEGAAQAYRASIDLIEARRSISTSNAIVKARHFATRAGAYRKLESVLLESRRFEEALAVAEQIKARALLDRLDGDSGQLPLTAEERNEQDRLNQAVVHANEVVMRSNGAEENAARRDLHAARSALDAFREDMGFRYANVAVSGGTVGEVALTKKRHAVVIEYAVMQDAIAAFVVRDGRVTARRIGPISSIEPIIRQLRDEVANHDLRAMREAARLYSAIWAPVEDLLPQHGEIDIVPDGLLWNVPFASLRNGRREFLIERYALSLAPSIALIDRMAGRRKRASRSDELLALGNPYIEGSTRKHAATYRDLSLGPLPDAENEVRRIAMLYGLNHSKVLIGRAATESALKQAAGAYRVIHLATHGIIDSESPLYSALVLSRRAADDNDGLLEMREMAPLHLNADLVVLSACDTGAGDIYPGEGIIGMSWAMLAAGCSQVVVSQWTADSRATSELMIEFHRQLKQHRSAPEALRRAELKLLKSARYNQPFYWAPFIVVGH